LISHGVPFKKRFPSVFANLRTNIRESATQMIIAYLDELNIVSVQGLVRYKIVCCSRKSVSVGRQHSFIDASSDNTLED